MSPLKANVLISNYVNILSVSVGKPKLGPTRDLNIYLQGPMPGIKPALVSKYKAVGLPTGYGVMRCTDAEPVGVCCTLAECQAVALSDYIQQAGLQLMPEESTQEV